MPHPGPPGSPVGPDAGLSLRGVRTVRLSADDVVLRRGLSEVRLGFPGVADLVDRLGERADGTVDEETLVSGFDVDVQPQVRRLVSGLRSRGMLHPPIPSEPDAVFWLSMSPFTDDGAARLAGSSVVVIGAGAVAEACAEALQACGVGSVQRCASAGEAPAADVWCATSEAAVEPALDLLETATTAHGSGTVFLPSWLEDLVARVGPMTHPDTSCLKCLLLRRASNDRQRDIHRLMQQTAGESRSGAGFLPPMAAVTGQVAAMEVVKHCAGLPVTTVGHAIELSLVPFRCDVRRVLRVPRCPLCSGIADRGAPVVAHASQLLE